MDIRSMTIYGLIHYQLLIKPAKSLSNDLGDLRTIMKGWWLQMRRLPAQMVTCLGIPGENQDQTAGQHMVPTYQKHQHISSSVCVVTATDVIIYLHVCSSIRTEKA